MNKRDIIINNYENPFHRGLLNDETYLTIKNKNSECIDEIQLMVKLDNDIISDIVFDGEACMIVISSTSILIKTLIGKTINEAKNIINNYESMIDQKAYDDSILGDLIMYDDIYRQPSRKLCARLSADAINKIINK